MNINYTLANCPLVEIIQRFKWTAIFVSGADDLERNFFPTHPDSTQPRLMNEIKEKIATIPTEDLEGLLIDTLVWLANMDIQLSHIVGDLKDEKDGGMIKHRENVVLLAFIEELWGEVKK